MQSSTAFLDYELPREQQPRIDYVLSCHSTMRVTILIHDAVSSMHSTEHRGGTLARCPKILASPDIGPK